MALPRRKQILGDFFRHHGWLAGIPDNYRHYLTAMCSLLEGRVESPTITGPVSTPNECMSRKTSYEYIIADINGTHVCSIPAMTDEGVFIIQGVEKVLLIQEVRLKTEHYVSNNPPSCECSIMGSYFPVKIWIEQQEDNKRKKEPSYYVLKLDTSMIKNELRNIKFVGVYELLVALFSTPIGDVYTLISRYCRDASIAKMCIVYVSKVGMAGLSKDDASVIRSKLFKDLPNYAVVMTVIPMIVECVAVMHGMSQISDRDGYSLKRLRTPGEIIYGLFKSCVKSRYIQLSVNKKIYSCLRRGEVIINGKKYDKMALQLSRRSSIDAISSVRKIIVPCDQNSPNLDMRQIHESQMGYVCPCETPEGKTVGIIKHLAATCLISTASDVKGYIMQLSINYRDCMIPQSETVWIMLDGAFTGVCSRRTAFMAFKHLKLVHPDVSCTISGIVLKVRSVAGRPVRPLMNVQSRPVDWDDISPWTDMVRAGTIHYVDPVECAINSIATTGYYRGWRSCSYMEIHPCTMLGLTASLIPFPEHTHSARHVFSSSMIKQSQQMIGSDKVCNMLQKPLIYTTIGREIGIDDNPNGINLLTCIMSITGYNQEDAIIFKRSSIDRGAFSSVMRKTLCVPVSNAWHIVEGEQSISVISGGAEKTVTDLKLKLRLPEARSQNIRVIERSSSARITSLDDKTGQLNITFEEHRTLQLGDKLSSRHAQKGVVGLIMSEEDMPFTSEGIVPDIIINPHAIPSRMTVGQLIEGVLGKDCCKSGTFADGTPFLRKGMKDIKEILKKSDTEYMTLGTTGETIRTPIAIGVVYYMALAHQAADKIYVRSAGPKSMMSRQPVSGRSKGGGLRFGEMEYDCLIAHGASKLATGVSENSDMQEVPYCEHCSVMLDNTPLCAYCGEEVVYKRVPFAYVVYKDLMLSAGIKVQTRI